MLVKNIPSHAVKVSREAALVDLHSIDDPARRAIHCLIGQLERRTAAAAFEVLYDPIANRLILLSRAVGVRVKVREKLIEGLLIEIPLAYLILPLAKARPGKDASLFDSLADLSPLALKHEARPVVGCLPSLLLPHFNLSISQSRRRTQAVPKHLCVKPLHQLRCCRVVHPP